jgi:hypothetical protein
MRHGLGHVADILQRFRGEAEGKTDARTTAEQELAAHRSRVAVLEDAAVAAARGRQSPERVPPSVWTALIAHPLQVLMLPDLSDETRALADLQVATLARLSGVADDMRAEGRAALEAEQADRTRAPRSCSPSATARSVSCPTPCTRARRSSSTARECRHDRPRPRGRREGHPLRLRELRPRCRGRG